MADLTPEHTSRRVYEGLHPEVSAAYKYVDSVVSTADVQSPTGGYAWHGWALREAFLAGCTHAGARSTKPVPSLGDLICKNCKSSKTDVIESRPCNNGTRRRRHRCLSCGYRWTKWDGPKPIRGRMAGSRSVSAKRGRQTTEEDVRRILLAPAGVANLQLAREMNFSPTWVGKIRAGYCCVNICPELKRRKPTPAPSSAKGRSCYSCFSWNSGCCFGFPEPDEEGPSYAQYCDLFKLREY